MAEKFAPIIVLDGNKKEIPSNLEKYYGRYELGYVESDRTKSGSLRTRYESEKLPYMILPEPESIPRYNSDTDPIHYYYHVRYADAYVSGTQAESLPGYRDDKNYWYSKGDEWVVISYWFWFDRNYGPSPLGNYHQGDWESFSVLADSNGNPLRVMTTGHNHITLDTSWNNINSIDHHPFLYIGSGRNSDGGNPVSAYGSYEVYLDAGTPFLNRLADPRDIFPDPAGNVKIILPYTMEKDDLDIVLIGANPKKGKLLDLRKKVYRKVNRLVKWEEPGWINLPSFQDPDQHHKVDTKIEAFLKFPGKIGKHPKSIIKPGDLKKFGSSPRNVPFKINIEQHYTYERPRQDRSHKGRIGDYGPKFIGNPDTPQFSLRYQNR